MTLNFSLDMDRILFMFELFSAILLIVIIVENVAYKKAYDFHKRVVSLGDLRKLDGLKQKKISKECIFYNRVFIILDTFKKISGIFSLTTFIILILFFLKAIF